MAHSAGACCPQCEGVRGFRYDIRIEHRCISTWDGMCLSHKYESNASNQPRTVVCMSCGGEVPNPYWRNVPRPCTD